MSRNICIAAALLMVGAAAVPLLFVSKWIGHFTLTVNLDLSSDIDASSITYVECRNSDEAQWLCNDHSGYVAGFREPDAKTANAHSVAITCMGDHGGYGLYETYHQPAFLVVQYRTLDAATNAYARKSLAIPTGRGPRHTTLTLP